MQTIGCRDVCLQYAVKRKKMAGEGFYNDHRYCRHCTKFYPLDVSWNKIYCICCHRRLANKPKSRKGKALLNGIHRY